MRPVGVPADDREHPVPQNDDDQAECSKPIDVCVALAGGHDKLDLMRLCVFTEPQLGVSYEQQLAMAQRAESLGFDGYFRSDHYISFAGSGEPGPTDSWVTLGALARETSRIRLGTLVTSATFRLPGPLAIAVAQVDAMSQGRIELGLGTGWFGQEHAAYGIPFPDIRERFDRFAEQLEIIHGLWTTPAGKTFSFQGEYFTLEDS